MPIKTHVTEIINNPFGIIAIVLGQLLITVAALVFGIQELYVTIPAIVFCVENALFVRMLKQDSAQRKRIYYACAYGMAKPYNPRRAAVPIVAFLLSCMFLLSGGYFIAATLAGVAALLHQASYDMLVNVCETGEVDERDFVEEDSTTEKKDEN